MDLLFSNGIDAIGVGISNQKYQQGEHGNHDQHKQNENRQQECHNDSGIGYMMDFMQPDDLNDQLPYGCDPTPHERDDIPCQCRLRIGDHPESGFISRFPPPSPTAASSG